MGDEFVGERFAERGVCPGEDRDPLIHFPRHRIRADRINHDRLHVVLLNRLQELPGHRAAGNPGDREVVTERHVELRVGDFGGRGRDLAAVGHREGRSDLGGGVGTFPIQVAAREVRETLPAVRAADRRLLRRRVVDVNGVRAVVLQDPLPVIGDQLIGLIPRDPLKFRFSPLADPLHRELQAIGVIEALPHGAASEARPQLIGLGAAGVRCVIGLDPDHLAVLRKDTEGAAVAAVHHAGTPIHVRHRVNRFFDT